MDSTILIAHCVLHGSYRSSYASVEASNVNSPPQPSLLSYCEAVLSYPFLLSLPRAFQKPVTRRMRAGLIGKAHTLPVLTIGTKAARLTLGST